MLKVTACLPLSITDSAPVEAQKISAAFDEFLGTIGVQRAVCKMAGVMQKTESSQALSIVNALIDSYRWECPVVSDAYWEKFGLEFTQKFMQYRTSDSWKERATVANDAALENVRTAVRSVGKGTLLPRKLVEEFCLLLGNRASWRRFAKFAQAEGCSLDDAFDRWYPCNRDRFMIEDEAQRAVLRIILTGLEKLRDEKSAYALFALVERLHNEGGLSIEASLVLSEESNDSPFTVQFLKVGNVASATTLAKNPFSELIAVAYCRKLRMSAPQRKQFEKLATDLRLTED